MGRSMKKVEITELSKFLLTGYQFSFSSVIVQIEYVFVLRGARLAILQQGGRVGETKGNA